MSISSKGSETMQHILYTCRELFYTNGYKKTSARTISQQAGTNLGLLNYYFKGKIHLGKQVYFDIRDEFNDLIKEFEPEMSELELFFFSSTVELYLCLTSKEFGRFYFEVIHETPVYGVIKSFIQKNLEKYAIYSEDIYPALAASSLCAVKPALVRHALNASENISIDTCIQYYLEQQLHYFKRDISEATHYLRHLRKYHIDVAANFTPIFVKLK